MRVPIQPFDDSLREKMRLAIAEQMEKCDPENYSPDDTGFVVDAVIAVLVGELLGISVKLAPQNFIGNGSLILNPNEK